MRRVLRWTFRALVAVFALIGLAVTIAVITIHTSYGRELIRKKAEGALAGAFPGSTIASVEPALFGTTTVHGVVLAGEGGAPMVQVDTIEASVALRPLVGKTVKIEKLEVTGVTFASAVKLPAKPPEPPKPPEPAGASSWSIEFPEVSVRDARVTGEDGAPLVDGVSVDAHAELAGGVIAAGAKVHATWRGHRIDAEANVRRDGAILYVPSATVNAGADSVSIVEVTFDGEHVGGHVTAHATKASIKELTGVELEGDVAVNAQTFTDGSIDLRAESGTANFHAIVGLDAKAERATAVVVADVPDATVIRKDAPPVSGAAFATLEADHDHARGIVTVRGTREGHTGNAVIALDATRTAGWMSLNATSDVGESRVSALANLTRKGDDVELVKSTVVARAGRVEAGQAAVAATIGDFTAHGRVWPNTDIRVDGSLDARGLTSAPYSADAARARLADVHVLAGGVRGAAHIEVDSARNAGAPYGSLALDAHGSAAGGNVTVDIDSHQIKTAKAGVWSGKGGHIALANDALAVRGFHTGNGTGSVDADAGMNLATGDFTASVNAKDFKLSMVAPDKNGTIAGNAKIARAHRRWDGTVTFTGKGVSVTPEHPPIDASGEVTIHGRALAASVSATSPTIGTVRVATKLQTPPDPTDARAWKRSERSAIESLKLELGNVQIAGAAPGMAGSLDGNAELTAKGADGTIRLRGLHTKVGDVEADATFEPDEHGHVETAVAARLGTLAAVNADGEIALPHHPFDPAEWQALGRDALAGGHVHAKDVAITPESLAKAGVQAPYHARVDFDAELATGATSLTAKLAVHDIRGGALVKPLELAADATIDEQNARANANVTSGQMPVAALVVTSPITIDSLRTTPVMTAPLTGTIGVPSVQSPAPANVHDLLALVGRDDILGGTLAGNVELAGSFGVPTAHAVLTAKDVAIRASVEGRPPAKLADLALDAHWTGTGGDLDITAHQADKGMLHVSGHGSLKELAALEGKVEAKGFDVAPLTAFAPGAIGAARGVLEANVDLKGIDPDTGDLRGKIHLHDARVPLASMVGTLRKGDLDLTIQDHFIDGKISGKLGSGEIGGAVSVQLAGSTPQKADVELDLKKISLIRAHQPVIDAHVEAHMKHGDHWTGDIEVAHAHVVIPNSGGHKLLESSAPSDMLFVDAPPKIEPWQREAPSHPYLVANIKILPTTLDILDEQYEVSGRGFGHLELSVGRDGIGAEGVIEAERGDIQLFGQRSQLDHGTVTFDGILDPLLDIEVVRDLDTLVVTADVGGRASGPTLTFSADQGSYSQGELLAYFVGGTPGGDRGEVGQAAVQAGAGVASNFLSKRINRGLDALLPVKLDLDMRYEAATSANSEALAVGRQLGRDTYLEYRNRVEARPDENQNEGMLEYRIKHTEWRLRGEIGDRGYDSGEIERRWHW